MQPPRRHGRVRLRPRLCPVALLPQRHTKTRAEGSAGGGQTNGSAALFAQPRQRRRHVRDAVGIQSERGRLASVGDRAHLRRVRRNRTKFLSLGLYIGINGCSLKTDDNLSVVEQLPLDRIILETDCPWCDIRPSHAGSKYVKTTFPTKKDKQYNRDLGKEHCVKNRTEPCHVAQVAEVIAGIKGAEVEEVAETCGWKNVHDLFGPLEKKGSS
ncbi:hypothetical protein ACHAWF_007391 [Thalassiosira exigua]